MHSNGPTDPARNPDPAPKTPPPTVEQLRLDQAPNAPEQLRRAREATLAVAQAERRPRYGPAPVALFAVLAMHTGPAGIARVSARQLAAELRRDLGNVKVDLRALIAGGFVVPLEHVDGAFVRATRHPRHRVAYLVPGMVAPPPTRPHVVR